MHCKLTSMHYRRSPLVQGGLEIKCKVVINSRATVLQSRLTACYLELIQNLYAEPVEKRLIGELVFSFVMTLPPMLNMSVLPTLKKRKKKATTTDATTRNQDIREMFSGSKKSKKTKRRKKVSRISVYYFRRQKLSEKCSKIAKIAKVSARESFCS